MTKASFVVMMLLLLQQVSGFVLPTPTTIRRQNDMTSLSMDMTSMILEPSSIVTSSVSTFPSSMTILAETEPWVQPLSLVLDPFLNFLSFAMVRTFFGFVRREDRYVSLSHISFLLLLSKKKKS